MNLPFTTQQFFHVFEQYNNAVFPLQGVFILFALLIIFVILKKIEKLYFLVWLLLAILWAWVGGIYHIKFFSPINPIANVFGILFIIESALIVFYGLVRKNIEIDFKPGIEKLFGGFLVAYSLIIYPLITIFSGHSYPALPTFGVPCPTTIFTIGIFLLTNLNKTSKILFIIPVLWTLIATSAAFKLQVYADVMLIFSSLLLYIGVVVSKKKLAYKA